jgi:hypothetical protein
MGSIRPRWEALTSYVARQSLSGVFLRGGNFGHQHCVVLDAGPITIWLYGSNGAVVFYK